jgi:hypothetical protein
LWQRLHRDQVLRREPVSDLRPVSPTRQMLEPLPVNAAMPERQTDPE